MKTKWGIQLKSRQKEKERERKRERKEYEIYINETMKQF